MKMFHLKIIIFTAFRNCCMLHEHVFVMRKSNTLLSLYPKVCELTSLSEKYEHIMDCLWIALKCRTVTMNLGDIIDVLLTF